MAASGVGAGRVKAGGLAGLRADARLGWARGDFGQGEAGSTTSGGVVGDRRGSLDSGVRHTSQSGAAGPGAARSRLPSTNGMGVISRDAVRSDRPPRTRLTATDLEARIREAVPHALVVSEHVMRRAVRADRSIHGVRTFVPHTHTLAVPRAELERAWGDEASDVVDRDGWVVLVPRGDDVSGDEVDAALVDAWRRLFHARMDEELGRRVASGVLSPARVRSLIDRVGQVPMDEARAVLEDEGLILAGADAVRELCELIALHAELRHFAPGLMASTFPSLDGRDDVTAMFEDVVRSADVLAETRVRGAPTPGGQHEQGPGGAERPVPQWRVRGLWREAERAEAHGRDVDAAVLAWRIKTMTTREQAEHDLAAALESRAVAALARKLAALGSGPADEGEWAAVVMALLPFARWGMATVAGRLLHDLQRACDDADGELWSHDLGRALRSFGRRSWRRREAIRQVVAIARHLMRAAGRVPATGLGDVERQRCQRALGAVVRKWEARVRAEVGATLIVGLDRADLTARDLPEGVARDKLVAELCDRMLARGFIAFPDVRDHVARNQLKLEDTRSVKELVSGDALLVFDRFLAEALAGAYRPAEGYRRFFHRLSALVFANPVGRFFVRYGALPFGGAFVLVKGFDLVILSLVAMVLGLESIPPPPGAPPGTPHEHALQIFSLPLMFALGAVLFLLLHVPATRTIGLAVARRVGSALRFVFVTVPRWVRSRPWVERLVRTRAFGFVHDHLWRPILYALLPTLVAVAIAGDASWWLWAGVPQVVAWSVFFATRPGRRFVESARDWGVQAWRDLRHDIVPGVVAALMEFFRAVVERVEVVLYVVDQRLRYRRGDSRVAMIVRAVLGLLWSMLAYLVRLIVNLVAEPQLNPIKHFPVVTIAHKVTIPWSIAVHQSLKDAGMSEAMASMLGLGAFQLVVPGIAGFLVWELKENWRLYRANRKEALGPVVVGSHGEPIYRFLRPGFHSGTVPTLFRKLRRAEKRGRATRARRVLAELHHVEEAVERFVEREVKTLLVRSGQLPEAEALRVEHVVLTPARISIELGCPPLGDAPLTLAFEEQSGFLIADVATVGFLPALGEPLAPRRVAFATALLGLYKLAGVDLVRAHLAAALPEGSAYDVTDRGLVVWDAGFQREVVYPLWLDAPMLRPAAAKDRQAGLPEIPTDQIAFKRRLIRWDEWRQAWGDAAATRALRDRVLGEQLLLPAVRVKPVVSAA